MLPVTSAFERSDRRAGGPHPDLEAQGKLLATADAVIE
jgi:hypothetical protein